MLSPETHARIIADLDHICHTANIPKLMMYKSAKDFCSGKELEWLTRFPVHQRNNQGLVLTGKHNPPPDLKMMSMAAALLRNYVDARVVTVQSIISSIIDNEEPADPTVLLIPNLYVRGQKAPEWKMSLVYDHLLSRFTAGKLTVVYVEDLKSMGQEYGQLFVQHLESNYQLA